MNFRHRHEFYYVDADSKCLAKSGYFEVIASELAMAMDMKKRVKVAREVVSQKEAEISNYEEQLAELNLEIEVGSDWLTWSMNEWNLFICC